MLAISEREGAGFICGCLAPVVKREVIRNEGLGGDKKCREHVADRHSGIRSDPTSKPWL